MGNADTHILPERGTSIDSIGLRVRRALVPTKIIMRALSRSVGRWPVMESTEQTGRSFQGPTLLPIVAVPVRGTTRQT